MKSAEIVEVDVGIIVEIKCSAVGVVRTASRTRYALLPRGVIV